jgi:DNA polymerase-1
MTMPRTWLLIDCNNVAARYFHAMPPMLVDDRPTGAIFGFLKCVLNLKDEFAASGLIFCFDKGFSLRKKVLPGYQKRPEKTENADPYRDKKHLDRQLRELRIDILPRIGMKNVFAVEGYEADDLVASACCHWAVKHGIIVSSDKDLFQCLRLCQSKRIDQYDLGKKELVTYRNFEDRYGIPPHDWNLVKAIAGCESDNIPGVEGVGERTAIKYVCGVLPKTNQTYQRIRASADLIARNESLVTLPYVGLRLPELREDEDDYNSWRRVLSEFKAERLVRT